MFIFKRDMKNLVTNIFAFLIAGGLCFIPSLYAWFNIYSNWDPYANTSAVNIAVFSEDEGYTDEDGNYSNIGEQVLESVKKSTSIGWVFTDTKDEAIEGVKSGKYYAAVIINNSFTYNIYNISKQDYKNPTITYYENSKKNAVAAKITDTAVSTLKTSINESLIKTMAGTVFDKTNVVADKLNNSESIDNMISEVEEISDKLTQMSTTIDTFISNNNELVQSMSDMKSQIPLINDRIDSGINKLNQTKTQFTTSTQDADSFASELSAMTDSISQSADTIRQTLNNAKIDEGLDTVKTSISMALNDTKNLENDLNTLVKTVINENTGIAASDTIQNIKNHINQILSQIEVNLDITPDITGDSIKKILDNSITQVDNLKKIYNNSLKPQLLTLTNNMTTVIDDVNTFLTGIASTVNGVSDVINGTDTTVNNINDSLTVTKQVVDDVNNKLQSAINEMRDKDYDEKKEILINLLSGDTKTLSEFFSEPVKVHTELIYEIANYGSGVAPFYTVLAIWVGALVLVSLIKVDADKKGLDNPSYMSCFLEDIFYFSCLGRFRQLYAYLETYIF
ncbi:MAG: YhgE/Pip domain-containing protein [Lachnospiraceae bacterium]|nr:YhgE/Pip domain-containing protein [Lachnospiraceae bacterium]